MKRREFIAMLGAAAAWPVAARAQQGGRMRRIGVLMGAIEHDPRSERRVALFEDELRARGWNAGVNPRIDYRWTGNDTERMKNFALNLPLLIPT